jgi:hypothetical protein
MLDEAPVAAATTTEVRPLPVRLREYLNSKGVAFNRIKTTPNFRYEVTLDSSVDGQIVDVNAETAKAAAETFINSLSEFPVQFKRLGDATIQFGETGATYLVVIKAQGYDAPGRAPAAPKMNAAQKLEAKAREAHSNWDELTEDERTDILAQMKKSTRKVAAPSIQDTEGFDGAEKPAKKEKVGRNAKMRQARQAHAEQADPTLDPEQATAFANELNDIVL